MYCSINGEFKRLIKKQIYQKLICFEGEAKKSKLMSAMKWWSNTDIMREHQVTQS